MTSARNINVAYGTPFNLIGAVLERNQFDHALVNIFSSAQSQNVAYMYVVPKICLLLFFEQ